MSHVKPGDPSEMVRVSFETRVPDGTSTDEDMISLGRFIEEVALGNASRKVEDHACSLCGELRCYGQDEMFPDRCLGWLPGVSGACCGHGSHEKAYVSITVSDDTNLVIKGYKALKYMEAVIGSYPYNHKAPPPGLARKDAKSS